MTDGCSWRIYLRQFEGETEIRPSIHVMKFWKGRCGITFQVDDLGVSPAVPFGRSVPAVAGLKPYVMIATIEDARPLFDSIRGMYIRRRLDNMGFSKGPGSVYDRERFLEAARDDDGSVTVSVSTATRHNSPVQSIWTVSPHTVRCHNRFLADEDGRYTQLVGEPIPEDGAEAIVADLLGQFFDNMLLSNLSWEPRGVTE